MRFYKSRKLRLALLIALPLAMLLYIAASVFGLYFFTTSPNRQPSPWTPANYDLPYENVTFTSAAPDHLPLQGWWIRNPKAERVLILVHVKNGNRGFGLEFARPLWQKGYSLLLFDLRGHGQSGGDHYTYGQYEQFDVLSAVNFVKAKGFAPSRIGAIGWSMGAASTLMGMSQTPELRAAVIDSAYGDLGRIAGQRLGLLNLFYPGLELSGQVLLGVNIDGIKPENAFSRLGDRHIMLVHGDADTTVPVSEVYHLQQVGGSHVTDTWILPGVPHAGAYFAHPAEYLKRVLAFFDKELD